MDSSPITNKTMGINNSNDKFRDVRKRANVEYKARKTKRNRKKPLPKYHIDEEFVATDGGCGSDKHYHLVKVIDFENARFNSDFEYYCILLKTTNHKMLERTGRIVAVQENGWLCRLSDAKVRDEGIKWLPTPC